MNIAELVTNVRDVVEEGTASLWSDNELVRYINRAYSQIQNEFIQMDESWGLDSITLDSVTKTEIAGGLSEFVLPDHVRKVIRVENLAGDSEVPGSSSTPIHLNVYAMAREAFSLGSTWFFGGTRKLIINAKDLTASEWRVWFIRDWAPLVRVVLPSVSSSLTLTMVTDTYSNLPRITNAMRGAKFESDVNESQFYYCTASGGMDLTFESITGLDSSDNLYSVPIIPEAHHESIAYRAAMRALDKEGNVQQKQAVAQTLEGLEQNMLNTEEKRQYQQPRYTNYFPHR